MQIGKQKRQQYSNQRPWASVWCSQSEGLSQEHCPRASSEFALPPILLPTYTALLKEETNIGEDLLFSSSRS